jgi:Fe-S-cluster-containing dehydrogenase component/CRP-like cAMP-binding protein
MTWPESVWSAPPLRPLDARARAEIEAAGALRAFARGERVFEAGQPADAFFVVAEGKVGVRAVRRGEVDATVLREIAQGESFGEEGSLRPGGTRHMEASALAASRVAEIPLGVFRRALGRGAGGGAEVVLRQERALRRTATKDVVRTLAFARHVDDRELDALLDAIEHVDLARGELLFREGEPATHVYFVADGMLQVQTEDDGKIRVRAYVVRGDVLGDEELATGAPRTVSAAASGAAWVLAIPRAAFLAFARPHAGLLDAVRRVAEEREEAQRAAGAMLTTRHVFKDLYRLQVARSLLVIDEGACVRCGHCAWSCAAAHEDGVSRLVRRGDKIVTRATEGDEPLLVPSSCQHCDNPACMPDCPTGAIGRDPRGEVFIREELCTGCGNCAKGCPWDNIQMAPRRGTAGPTRTGDVAERAPGRTKDVAVKCDLCKGRSGGPACVSSCPTSAILRVNPEEAIPEVGAALGVRARTLLPRARAIWPLAAGAVPVAAALSLHRATTRASYLWTGGVAAALLVALAGYAIVKRVIRPRLRPWLGVHYALGIAATGAVVAHAGPQVPANVAGALQLAFWSAAASGALGAFVYRVLPARLSRVERKGALPEDLPEQQRELEERTFVELTGKSEVLKTLWSRVLKPYAHAAYGPAALLASGRTLGDEQRRLRARIERVLGGRGQDDGKLRGLDALVRLAVERRALPLQRALQAALRAWAPLHVALTAIALVLLALHVWLATRYR